LSGESIRKLNQSGRKILKTGVRKLPGRSRSPLLELYRQSLFGIGPKKTDH
jgi:hypothetical protein